MRDDLETLRIMMNELVQEIQKLRMDPKLESPWWTSTFEKEDENKEP